MSKELKIPEDAAYREIWEKARGLQSEMDEVIAERDALAAQLAELKDQDLMHFEYRHPNGELHAVTVSRDEVLREMPDFLFEKLCGKFCKCEPIGETNIIECNCDEYAEEFKLLAAAPQPAAQEGE